MTPITRAIAYLFVILPAGPALAQNYADNVIAGSEPFTMRVVTSGLEGPWELTLGPDEMLWVTERTAGRVTRIDPETGNREVLATLADVAAPGSQDGLLGLALDPGLMTGTGRDFVYVAYTYRDPAHTPEPTLYKPEVYSDLFTKLVRLTYDLESHTLGSPLVLISGLLASNDHNSGRLKFGPDGKLYYAIGDQGHNQRGNACLPIEAQRLPTRAEIAAGDYSAYVGKSLRLNPDGSIPDDNPVLNGVRSHVFTYGHRNMQGIDFAPDGTLYASEQGPDTDDEINILTAGHNYGWPHVAGFLDDAEYQYARWSDASTPCDTLKYDSMNIDRSVPRQNESDWNGTFTPPIATVFSARPGHDFEAEDCGGMLYLCRPTIAAASIEVYAPDEGGIPGWAPSLLVPALKRGSLYRVPLTENGTVSDAPIERHFRTENRYRDTAVSVDLRTIYVATDPDGVAEGLDGSRIRKMQNPGAILAFTYDGPDTP